MKRHQPWLNVNDIESLKINLEIVFGTESSQSLESIKLPINEKTRINWRIQHTFWNLRNTHIHLTIDCSENKNHDFGIHNYDELNSIALKDDTGNEIELTRTEINIKPINENLEGCFIKMKRILGEDTILSEGTSEKLEIQCNKWSKIYIHLDKQLLECEKVVSVIFTDKEPINVKCLITGKPFPFYKIKTDPENFQDSTEKFTYSTSLETKPKSSKLMKISIPKTPFLQKNHLKYVHIMIEDNREAIVKTVIIKSESKMEVKLTKSVVKQSNNKEIQILQCQILEHLQVTKYKFYGPHLTTIELESPLYILSEPTSMKDKPLSRSGSALASAKMKTKPFTRSKSIGEKSSSEELLKTNEKVSEKWSCSGTNSIGEFKSESIQLSKLKSYKKYQNRYPQDLPQSKQ